MWDNEEDEHNVTPGHDKGEIHSNENSSGHSTTSWIADEDRAKASTVWTNPKGSYWQRRTAPAHRLTFMHHMYIIIIIIRCIKYSWDYTRPVQKWFFLIICGVVLLTIWWRDEHVQQIQSFSLRDSKSVSVSETTFEWKNVKEHPARKHPWRQIHHYLNCIR